MTADPLREKLKALVEEWRDWCERMPALYSERLTREVDADQLAALLAESEPCTVQECKDLGQCACFREPDMVASAPGEKWVGHVSRSHPGKTHYQGDSCPGGHASVCGYCGAKCERCTQPALKLGHEFQRCWNEEDDPYSPPDECCCGQPREAH